MDENAHRALRTAVALKNWTNSLGAHGLSYAGNMSRNLWPTLHADQVDHAELQQVIQRHFPSASQPGLREIVYPGEDPFAIKLVYAKTDQLSAIEAGPLLTPEVEEKLSRAVAEALLAPAGYKV